VFQQSVITYQAYNPWPGWNPTDGYAGASLYAFQTNGNFVGLPADLEPSSPHRNYADDLALIRSRDDGATWEPARLIYDPGQINQTIGNQIVVPAAGAASGMLIDGFDLILTKGGLGNNQRESFSVAVIRSSDGGATWSQPIIVAQQNFAGVSIAGHAVRSSDELPEFAAGPDGNVWFGEGSTGKIAFITPAGQITERQFSFFGVSVGITTGSDGNIWFSDQTDHAIWRYNLSSGVFTEFKTPTPNSFPGDMTLGDDGNVWFTEQAVSKFGQITPSGQITEFTGVNSPTSIASGPDGNIWIASAFTPTIARVTPAIEITIFPVPHTPSIIRPGADDNLLFTSFTGNTIASITTDGVVTESTPFANSAPLGIVAGTRGQVWFLGNGSNRVYRTVFP
jgi:streptogramin lyase